MNDTLREPSQRRVSTWLAWAFLVLSPCLLLLVLSLATGHNVLSGMPVWSDELDYWRAVYSWLNAGMRTGYNGVGEHVADWGSLSVHGPTPILLYGGFAKVFGWPYCGVMVCNTLWVMAGALTLCLLLKPGAKLAIALGVSIMAYAPVVLYAMTGMTELVNYGLLLFYLAFLLCYERGRGAPSLVLCTLTILFMCAYRITYFVLFLPLLLVAFRRVSWKLIGALAAAGAACVGVYWVTAQYTSPYSAGFLYNFMRTDSLALAVQMFLSHAKANLFDYFLRYTESKMEVAQRWSYCIVTGLCLLCSFVGVKKGEKRLRLRWDGMAFACFLMLFVSFGVVVVAYETNDWSDYRTLAPVLWCVAALLAARGHKLIPASFLALCLVMLVTLSTMGPVGSFADEKRFTPDAEDPELTALCEAITFNPDAKDPFANTIRCDDLYNPQSIRELAPGLGIQTGWFTEDNTGKSDWILTSHLKIVVQGYEQVAYTPRGYVYRKIEPLE
ncbi:MAG: hypothetical protein PHY12_13115 [Eubacteriales bacterium]|nr:hypothetical protein [Eubacteriales bacterium]